MKAKQVIELLAEGRIREAVELAEEIGEVSECDSNDCYELIRLELPEDASMLLWDLALAAGEDIDDIYEYVSGHDFYYARHEDRAIVAIGTGAGWRIYLICFS